MYQLLPTPVTATLKSHYSFQAIKGHASYECSFLGHVPTHLLF